MNRTLACCNLTTYFNEKNSLLAANMLSPLLEEQGVEQIASTFIEMIAEEEESTKAALFLERFRVVIATQSVQDNLPVQKIANEIFAVLGEEEGCSFMIASCFAGYVELVEILFHQFRVSLGVIDQNRSNYSLLHDAVIQGHTRLVKWLVDHNAPLDLRESAFRRTPLHLACELGKGKEMEILLEGGADVNALDKENLSPLHLACSKTSKKCSPILRTKMAMRLIAHGANAKLPNLQNLNATAYLNKPIFFRHQFKLQNDFNIPPFTRDLWIFIIQRNSRSHTFKKLRLVSKTFYNLATRALALEFLSA